MKYKIDTYRDGGTVSISEDDIQLFCINNMINEDEHLLDAVYTCYPTRGIPIAGLPELTRAKRILTEAVADCNYQNEMNRMDDGLKWIETQLEAAAVCDRTKVEVLARELCIEYWNGLTYMIHHGMSTGSVREFTEMNWERWEQTATNLLELLEKHK